MTGGVFGDPNTDAWWDDEWPDEPPPRSVVTVELPPYDDPVEAAGITTVIYRQEET